MSLANDKIGHHVRLISANALVSSTVVRSGFENVCLFRFGKQKYPQGVGR